MTYSVCSYSTTSTSTGLQVLQVPAQYYKYHKYHSVVVCYTTRKGQACVGVQGERSATHMRVAARWLRAVGLHTVTVLFECDELPK